jgi:hypothetical protein
MSAPVLAALILTQEKQLGEAIYHDFLPSALINGQIRPAPKPDVVGHGLEYVQTALDRSRAGVSASKIVVTL